MEKEFPPQLLEGLSVYQDLVLEGKTVRSGHRQCAERWEAIEPHLPPQGTILDVGSNFGWFGLQICRTRPDCVVASLEADLRSAEVQRQVLESNDCRRICLLTGRAGAALVRRFQLAGQHVDAALCLSVLHWIGDHRPFLAALGKITGRILVEQPDPREDGAGVRSIREEIGAIGDYLRAVFPNRPVQRLAQWPSHRHTPYQRELWLVAEPADWPADPSPGLDVSALLDLSPGWPPRSWWMKELAGCEPPNARHHRSTTHPSLLFTPSGLVGNASKPIARCVARVPEHHAFSTGRRRWYAARRAVGNLLRRMRLR